MLLVTVVVPGVLAFLQLGHRPFSLPGLSIQAVRVLGQELSLVFCAMLCMVDLGCSCPSSCTDIKIVVTKMTACLGGRRKKMDW